VADENLRSALRGMPVPEPRPGFEDRVLAKAVRARPARRHASWWAAGAGALAATIAWVAVIWLQSGAPGEPTLVLSLHESREVPVVIDSERELEGAIIRIHVTGSVTLDGFDQQHDIEWQATLTRGANVISLPVVARAPGEGRIVAEIQHRGKTRRVSFAMHVTAPARRGDIA
jgi:hypothetical protein